MTRNDRLRILLTSPCNYNASGELLTPPLSLAHLTAAVEAKVPDVEFKVGLATEEELNDYKPHIVGVSAYTATWTHVKDIARRSKARGMGVIVGGPHVSVRSQDLTADMDVGVIGEGEMNFPLLVEKFDDGWKESDLTGIHGLIYKSDETGELTRTPPSAVIKPLDQLPMPRMDLTTTNNDLLCMMSSRGCPFLCTFCATPSHRSVRVFSPEYVVSYIKYHVQKYPTIRIIKFWDDLFTIHRRRLKEIVRALKENNLINGFQYSIATRADHIKPETVELFKEMNVTDVSMGLETGSPTTLEYIKKGYTVDDIRNAVTLLHDAGINTQASFIIGFPEETHTDIEMTYNLIKELPLNLLQVFLLIPYPGTFIWEDAVARGAIELTDDFDWSRLDILASLERPEHVMENGVIVSKRLSREELYGWLKRFRRLVVKKRLLFAFRLIMRDPLRLLHRLKRESEFYLGHIFTEKPVR